MVINKTNQILNFDERHCINEYKSAYVLRCRSTKKTFDTIDHSILLSKLELYGLTGNALSMIRSYLSGRNKKCQLGDKMSTAKRIECGIPQGSILGPLFFLIYIDLPQCFKSCYCPAVCR